MTIFDDYPETAGKDMSWGRFYTKAVQDDEQSQIQGVPVFRNAHYVEIRLRDDPFFSAHQEVTDEHRHKWPRQWELYQKAGALAEDGVPIELFPLLLGNPAAIATLKHHGLTTIERLAELSDEQARKVGPSAADLRERARHYLQPDSKTVGELRAKVMRMSKEIAHWKAQADGLAEQMIKARQDKAA